MKARTGLATLFAFAIAAGCATTTSTNAAHARDDDAGDDEAHARGETVEVVRKSLVARAVRESATTTRSNVARLVTMVPLDEKKRAKMADAVSHLLLTERMENAVALRLEKALSHDEIHQLGEQLARDDVGAVIAAATGADPAAHDLERFLQDPSSMTAERQKHVKDLVEASWSPLVIDRLTRAPVAAAAKMVAAGVEDPGRKVDILRIVQSAPPGDPQALVIAFAFLWRDLDDATLDSARAYFSSDAGKKATDALVDAAVGALDDVAGEVERRTRS